MSDPTAFKIPQVPSSALAALGLYSWSCILNAVESSIALSNYYVDNVKYLMLLLANS